MILRRLAQNLREQNWTAITIEFVLLVAGVFLGLQVGNWNQQRGLDRQAAVFTERLVGDLREENWRAEFLMAYHREVLANANRAVAALEGRADLSDEALLVSAYRASQYKEGIRRRATFDELVSTGNIGLVRDDTVRDTAMRVFTTATFDNLVREGVNSRYRTAFRMSLPNEVQRALGKRCGDRYIAPGDYARIRGVLDYPCTTGLPPEAVAAAAQALRTDPELRAALRLRIADIETRLFDVNSNQRELWETLRRIAGPRGPQAPAAVSAP
jgi:hypothetical protein